ncbi:MAG: sirohydrochlorin chelatase [Acidimicrobiales bacterium]
MSTAWVVVAHGSRAVDLPDAHGAVCDRVAERSPDNVSVRPAYLELTEPSIPDAIAAAVGDGSTEVVVVPYFLHIGNHTRRDLPAIVDEARVRHPGVRIMLADHLGLDDRLVDLLVDRAESATTGSSDQEP